MGSFFFVNLAVAVVYIRFEQAKKDEEERQKVRLEAIEALAQQADTTEKMNQLEDLVKNEEEKMLVRTVAQPKQPSFSSRFAMSFRRIKNSRRVQTATTLGMSIHFTIANHFHRFDGKRDG